MIIARKKRKENIAEYILYMYQVEDLIRAFHSDMELIENHLVKSYKADEETSEEITAWYGNLVAMMHKEGIRENGHLQFISNLLDEVNVVHLKLLSTAVDKMYSSVFESVRGLISELRHKNPNKAADVNVAIDGIYGYLMLKIQKKEIHKETEEAVRRLSSWLAYLSKLFKDFENGDIDI